MNESRNELEFKPKLVAFVCNWCSYAGADKAGLQKMTYTDNVSLIRVMCSGRVDPTFVLQSFREGADGVMVLGCHPGDCHYRNGNMKTLKRSVLLENILEQFGIEKDRLLVDWVAAGESERFVKIVTQMEDKVKQLGALKIREEQ